MTTATKQRSEYVSGWHYGGTDSLCTGEYSGVTCTHPYHQQTQDETVNADSFPAKDTPTAAAAAAGVPAALVPGSVPAGGVSGPPLAGTLDLDTIDLTGTVADLSRDVAGWIDSSIELEVLDALTTVRTARQDLAQIEAVLEQRAAKVMTGDVVEWPGGIAERRYGKTRKEWAHDDLVRQVVNLIAVDVATDKTSGETDDMLAALLRDACARFAETHRPDWRVTSLKHMGVDPDEYCHAIPGRTTVQITQVGPQ